MLDETSQLLWAKFEPSVLLTHLDAICSCIRPITLLDLYSHTRKHNEVLMLHECFVVPILCPNVASISGTCTAHLFGCAAFTRCPAAVGTTPKTSVVPDVKLMPPSNTHSRIPCSAVPTAVRGAIQSFVVRLMKSFGKCLKHLISNPFMGPGSFCHIERL